MAVEHLKETWISIFKTNDLSENIAVEEFDSWVEGLGGEINNEYHQTELSVSLAAQEAVEELRAYGE